MRGPEEAAPHKKRTQLAGLVGPEKNPWVGNLREPVEAGSQAIGLLKAGGAVPGVCMQPNHSACQRVSLGGPQTNPTVNSAVKTGERPGVFTRLEEANYQLIGESGAVARHFFANKAAFDWMTDGWPKPEVRGPGPQSGDFRKNHPLTPTPPATHSSDPQEECVSNHHPGTRPYQAGAQNGGNPCLNFEFGTRPLQAGAKNRGNPCTNFGIQNSPQNTQSGMWTPPQKPQLFQNDPRLDGYGGMAGPNPNIQSDFGGLANRPPVTWSPPPWQLNTPPPRPSNPTLRPVHSAETVPQNGWQPVGGTRSAPSENVFVDIELGNWGMTQGENQVSSTPPQMRGTPMGGHSVVFTPDPHLLPLPHSMSTSTSGVDRPHDRWPSESDLAHRHGQIFTPPFCSPGPSMGSLATPTGLMATSSCAGPKPPRFGGEGPRRASACGPQLPVCHYEAGNFSILTMKEINDFADKVVKSGKGAAKASGSCFDCHKSGHFARDCTKERKPPRPNTWTANEGPF